MRPDRLVSAAATPLGEAARGVTDDLLQAPTPCEGYDVGALIAHLLHWAPSLAGAGRKRPAPAPAADPAPLGPGWRALLAERTADLVSAWGEPSAWEGATRIVGATEMPAEMIGGMVLTEFTVHAWDLARATGGTVRWDADAVQYTHDAVARTAEMGRTMGAYGPEVAVPETAPVLDRLLGLTGRDPAWKPS